MSINTSESTNFFNIPFDIRQIIYNNVRNYKKYDKLKHYFSNADLFNSIYIYFNIIGDDDFYKYNIKILDNELSKKNDTTTHCNITNRYQKIFKDELFKYYTKYC